MRLARAHLPHPRVRQELRGRLGQLRREPPGRLGGAVIDGPIDAMGPAPQAVATIGPKEKAYAGLFLFRGSEPTVSIDAVSIGYQDRALNSNRESSMLDVALSKEIGSLNVGTNARVTYWNRDVRAIEDFLFRSGTR
ncbi:hypothetical protein [Streptomyces avidinii]